VAQSFTATYSDPDGWQNIANAFFSITVTGHEEHNQRVGYSPATNSLTLLGAGGSCMPGQSGTLSTSALTLNCGASSASGSGTTLMVTFSLTPQISLTGTHPLRISVSDLAGAIDSKSAGQWTVHHTKDK
jgi:hypothetical protein